MASDKNQAIKRGMRSVSGGKASRSPFGRSEGREAAAMFADVPGCAAILDAVASAGDAIILGRTSDGGAVSVCLLAGDRRDRVYAREQAELDALFGDLAVAYCGGDDDPAASVQKRAA